MSLFRKPKKIQRRVFSSALEDDENGTHGMDMDEEMAAPPPPIITKKDKSKDSKKLNSKSFAGNAAASAAGGGGGCVGTDGKSVKIKSLLSFADDEDDAEVFQVRKSSHSKKMMRMLDKERRKKKKEERDPQSTSSDVHDRGGNENGRSSNFGNSTHMGSSVSSSSLSSSGSKYKNSSSSTSTALANEQCKSKKTDSIQTEIRTDDFVLVVKKSEPDLVLNGRAALCAGRNDMSDEEDNNGDANDDHSGGHRFSKPEQLKQMLESGSIPDAAMIHAARKRRQKAREQGDYIPVEEPKETTKKGSRLAREDVEGDNSDDEERVDMNAITGIKEREERREQFYSVQNDYSEEDSEHETNEWENQQIRKGVTGAQLVSAQHESVLSRFMIKSSNANALEYNQEPKSTSTLLEEAYAKSAFEKPQQIMATTKMKKDKTKIASLRSPHEIRDAIKTRLTKLNELYSKHTADIVRITTELKTVKLDELDCTQKAPTAAARYRFYQEVKCYITDLIDCLNEKNPLISDLEKRTLHIFAKHRHFLIERRRQDVRDQAKEMAEAAKPTAMRRGPEYEEQVRRAAEREGRRTRRRCDREKNDLLTSHLDGMSSDDETSDRYQEQFHNGLEQIEKESEEIFSDVNEEFCKVDFILTKFCSWRETDMESYKDAFVSLCLPKILGPIIRYEMLSWSPLLEEYKDIEKMMWYSAAMLYAWSDHETQESLKQDPDVHLVPTIIEKIILPKITDIVLQCWDPLSTTQTLRLIGFINRLGRDYPLKGTSKTLQHLFDAILEKMKLALENDVFIPIFPKQVQEAKTSFFQRQFCSGLKLFRNFLSWQGIIADGALRELAIGSLLNRYLLLAMRVCSTNDAIAKAYIIVNTLPTVWLQPGSETIKSLELFIKYVKQILENCDSKNPLLLQTCDKAKQILQRLHST